MIYDIRMNQIDLLFLRLHLSHTMAVSCSSLQKYQISLYDKAMFRL